MSASLPDPVADPQVSAVRAFNRFHTRLVGALNRKMSYSDYALPQVRVLYEIAHPSGAAPSARDLGGLLGMDKGYLSRILARLERDGLIARTPSEGNAKRLALTMTGKGRAVMAEMERASAEEVAALLEPLGPGERQDLSLAMAAVRRLLGDPTRPEIVLRDPGPGDLGYIIHRQALLYAREYGWNAVFEGLVSEVVGQFVREFDPAGERCWIADMGGEIVGSVFVVRQDTETAKLRLLYVEAAARGQGLGRRLVEACLDFARARGYRRMMLWTNDPLVAARRIYEALGFELVEESRHADFGPEMTGQVWSKAL